MKNQLVTFFSYSDRSIDRRVGKKAYYAYDSISRLVEDEDLWDRMIRERKELREIEKRGLFFPVEEEYSYCPYCGRKLLKSGLCKVCDLGIEVDPDELEGF